METHIKRQQYSQKTLNNLIFTDTPEASNLSDILASGNNVNLAKRLMRADQQFTPTRVNISPPFSAKNGEQFANASYINLLHVGYLRRDIPIPTQTSWDVYFVLASLLTASPSVGETSLLARRFREKTTNALVQHFKNTYYHVFNLMCRNCYLYSGEINCHRMQNCIYFRAHTPCPLCLKQGITSTHWATECNIPMTNVEIRAPTSNELEQFIAEEM